MSFIEQSHPDHRTEQQEAREATATANQIELSDVVTRIRAWQEGRSPRISDEQMLRDFPGLGSTKTYRRLRDRDFDGLILDRHLVNYKGVWLQISERTGCNGREEIYPDLTPTFEACCGAALLIPQYGRERLMLLEGETGSGKTMALLAVALRYPGQCAMIEAKSSWTSMNAMVCDMLVGLGIFSDPNDDPDSRMPISFGSKLGALIAHLKAKRMVLLIDEGHHMCAEGLNVIKSVLNATDSVIIVACIPTLWSKLAAKAWAEAAQLVYNRLFRRIRLTPPEQEDAEMFLTRRVPALKESDEWRAALASICKAARAYGSYSFLRRLSIRLVQCKAITPAVILDEVESLKSQLSTRETKPKAA